MAAVARRCARRSLPVLASFFANTVAQAAVEGRRSDAWQCTIGVVQGSVLSPLLAALFLVKLSEAVASAGGGARWSDAAGQVQLSHSFWYVDDGALIAEAAASLQRMLDAAARWARQWRMSFRMGADKSAVMCSAGARAARSCPVYLKNPGCPRTQLPAVGVYPYLGVPIGPRGLHASAAKAVSNLCRGCTWSVVRVVAREEISVAGAEALWQERAWSAIRYVLPFVPSSQAAVRRLSDAQLAWGRALLGWPHEAPGPAVLGDLARTHILFSMQQLRVALLARCMGPHTSAAAGQARELVGAAMQQPEGWCRDSLSIVMSACPHVQVPPPGAAAWVSVSAAVGSALATADESIWRVTVTSHPMLSGYSLPAAARRFSPVLGAGPSSIGLSAVREFGTVRAGMSPAQADHNGACPACGSAERPSIGQVLRRCRSTGEARHRWLSQLDESGFRAAMANEDGPALRVALPADARAGALSSAVRFVAAACAAARSAAERRRQP